MVRPVAMVGYRLRGQQQEDWAAEKVPCPPCRRVSGSQRAQPKIRLTYNLTHLDGLSRIESEAIEE